MSGQEANPFGTPDAFLQYVEQSAAELKDILRKEGKPVDDPTFREGAKSMLTVVTEALGMAIMEGASADAALSFLASLLPQLMEVAGVDPAGMIRSPECAQAFGWENGE